MRLAVGSSSLLLVLGSYACSHGASSVAATPDAGPYGPYANAGPDTVTSAAFSVTSPSAAYTVIAYVPSSAGPHPVVILSSGFFQDGVAYAAYAERLASWGIVTLLRNDPGLTESTADVVSDVSYEVTSWLPSQNEDAASALHGEVDPSRIGLAGHSRGGQVALLAAEALPGKIKGVFGLDPVDTTTAPEASTAIATIGLPLAFIGETTDDADSGCAPEGVDFVAITVPGADHTMFESPNNCSLCSLCTAGTASQALVESTAVRYLTSYFARQLLGDASVGATFTGAGASEDVAAGTVQIESK
jgi:dienelactone hydrolase